MVIVGAMIFLFFQKGIEKSAIYLFIIALFWL